MTNDRTFFLRREYTTKEMYDRIYSEDFIAEFKQYALPSAENPDVPDINKNSCYAGLFEAYRAGAEEEFHHIIETAFLQLGRRGDRLNVKLFRLNPEYRYQISADKLATVERICNQQENIRGNDQLNPGLEYDLYIADYNVSESNLDLRFKIDIETFIHEPVPSRAITSVYCESRVYTETGIVALFINEATNKQIRDILHVIHLLFHIVNPRSSEILFDEAQLTMIQLRLNGLVSSPKYKSEDDDDLRVEVHGVNEINYENPIVQLVQGQERLRMYELTANCVIEGHHFNLKLSADGKIQIESYVLPSVLDKIIQDIDWVIFTKEFYQGIQTQIEQTLRTKQRAMLAMRRQQKINLITSDLKNMSQDFGIRTVDKRKVAVISTILFNMGLFLCEKDMENRNETTRYNNLAAYYTDHLVVNKRKNRSESESKANAVVIALQGLCSNSLGDAVSLIECYQDLVRG